MKELVNLISLAEDFNSCQEEMMRLVVKLLNIENIFSFEDSDDEGDHFILTTIRNEKYEFNNFEIVFSKTLLAPDSIDLSQKVSEERIVEIKTEMAEIEKFKLCIYIYWYDCEGEHQYKYIKFDEIKEIRLI